MAVGIVRTAWAGTSGGPGLTQLAFAETSSGGSGSFFTTTNVQSTVNNVRTFWDALKGWIPNEVTLTVSPVVDIYDEVNGELIASISAPTAPTSVAGGGTATYSMAAGLKMNLNTGVIRNGRRVRGAIYVVPIASDAFTAVGMANGTTRTAYNTAGATLISSQNTALLPLMVWSRPLPETHPKGPRDGALATVSTIETNEKTAILRGRRD